MERQWEGRRERKAGIGWVFCCSPSIRGMKEARWIQGQQTWCPRLQTALLKWRMCPCAEWPKVSRWWKQTGSEANMPTSALRESPGPLPTEPLYPAGKSAGPAMFIPPGKSHCFCLFCMCSQNSLLQVCWAPSVCQVAGQLPAAPGRILNSSHAAQGEFYFPFTEYALNIFMYCYSDILQIDLFPKKGKSSREKGLGSSLSWDKAGCYWCSFPTVGRGNSPRNIGICTQCKNEAACWVTEKLIALWEFIRYNLFTY